MILHASMVQGMAKDISADEIVNKMIDKLSSQGYSTNLDGTTLGKTHADKGLGLPMAQTRLMSNGGQFMRPASKYSFASLPGPTALKNAVASKVQEQNGCRDVSMNAVPKFWTEGEPLAESKVREMAGVTAPMGLWDPIGIATNVPEGKLLFYREAELKHGRVCMLAVLGLIVGERQDFFKFAPFNDVPKDMLAFSLGTPAIQQTSLKDFWPAAFTFLGIFELLWHTSEAHRTRPPGDYGWDPLGLRPKDAKGLKEIQDKELNNGRLAMLAAAGWIAQEQAKGKPLWPFLQH